MQDSVPALYPQSHPFPVPPNFSQHPLDVWHKAPHGFHMAPSTLASDPPGSASCIPLCNPPTPCLSLPTSPCSSCFPPGSYPHPFKALEILLYSPFLCL